MATSSFLDRLRPQGRFRPNALASTALGPIGRAVGVRRRPPDPSLRHVPGAGPVPRPRTRRRGYAGPAVGPVGGGGPAFPPALAGRRYSFRRTNRGSPPPPASAAWFRAGP